MAGYCSAHRYYEKTCHICTAQPPTAEDEMETVLREIETSAPRATVLPFADKVAEKKRQQKAAIYREIIAGCAHLMPSKG